MKSRICLSVIATALAVTAYAQSNVMHLCVDRPGAEIQPTMYGIFIEDINFAADGGLYAELVKNRSFEFPDHLQGWKAAGRFELMDDGPFDRNPHYLRLVWPGHPHKHTALENDGFFGIGVKAGADYRFSVWARVPDGRPGSLEVQLMDRSSMAEDQAFASARITVDSPEWKKYELVLHSDVTNPKAALRIFLSGRETVDVEHVSLFPVDTWKGRENGLRKDLAQALYDLHPGLFRFPGGCIVEGTDLQTRYRWKDSVGPVENRPLNENRWQYTFTHRFFPDYYQSYGLGFYEYFLLSEDIGAEPLPVLSCGLACQYQNDDESSHQPVGELRDYIDDALDLIEFANGDVSTEWGALRAAMGHPEPFGLKFIAIGNEQWGETYVEHLEPFVKAIREAYPEIRIVGSSGPNSEGEQFDYLWPEMARLGADLVDEHFYRPEKWFLAQGARYDNYDRKGPKVFAGEYACHGAGKKWNHFEAALLEAAFMTGLERNADIVHMATYAPLFAHVEGWQWRPDLIWFDNLRSMRSCSYYIQQLYTTYKGTNVLELKAEDGRNVTGADGQNGLFASSVLDAGNGRIYVKIANVSDSVQPVRIDFDGLRRKEVMKGVGIVTYHSDDPDADNTLDEPEKIVPKTAALDFEGRSLSTEIGPKTFAVYVLEKR
ncbi:MAG TPA: carbohydrate binding domain-containing protein [Candidatus Cryptobacteroides merdipullorum]|uniref:non-reducing end alpha-L-arabinofuranosidase n=1 Tax=Candidatus Cryptobacteroides merdipullorum TaxID=2840771 RepID=A0A9D1KGT5_9BACT|nr:carbohydrate binding domain-containing protein [Candidatus Cryptobacteroides merdipullorum]